MNKCLVCWKEYHNSKYCIEYRPEIRNYNGTKMRKSSKLNQIRLVIESMEISRRQKFSRLDHRAKKIISHTPLMLAVQNVGTQVEL